MNLRFLTTLLVLFPTVVFAATRGENARVGAMRVSAASRGGAAASAAANAAAAVANAKAPAAAEGGTGVVITEESAQEAVAVAPSGNCRDAYRACMDEFCLLDESEGYRCACSSNINASKALIQEVQKIQEEADKLYTEGVEREQLGAKAVLVFGESEAAKKSSRASGLSFAEWLNSGSGDESLDADDDIGDGLYALAAEYCQAELDACGDKAEMEEMLYGRQIIADCKSFTTYLSDQKRNAEANKRMAESAVRQARLEMLDTTNKYNAGECLIAFRACVADKGGCGTDFTNCLDSSLLERRSKACENVLDQCMAARDEVLQDWEAESKSILAKAKVDADKYRRQTCNAQIQVCLEDGCSTSTDSTCLTNINVAAGICPIIDECNALIPGLKQSVAEKLGSLRLQFCQNDVDACLRDKCGANFTAPECVGKSPMEIVELCPQNIFPSCKDQEQYDIIVSAALLQMDYQMMQGCMNYFSEQLGKACGTDMACLPSNSYVASLTEWPSTKTAREAQRNATISVAEAEVDNFFKQFEKDKTVAACVSAEQPKGGRASLGESVFSSAMVIAKIGATNRAVRELESKWLELGRKAGLATGREQCESTYQIEDPSAKSDEDKNYTYISSVAFEAATCNCHVCRKQRVCEVGGETKAAAGLKAAAGGLSAGASVGTMVTPGWGTAIGAVIGAVGVGLGAGLSAGEKEFCQELEVCEDVAMSCEADSVSVTSGRSATSVRTAAQIKESVKASVAAATSARN